MDIVRQAALLTLYEVDKNGAYVNLALKERLAKNKAFTGKDKAFLTNLVYGVKKREITLDYIIGCYSKIKLKKISPYILEILRLGIYQIKFMDKVPQSAAVNESVSLAKRYGHKASAGFVNGILRNVSRNDTEYPKDELENISVRYSFPKWLVKMWIDDYGKDFTIELMEAMNKDPRVSIRVNTLKTTSEELLKKLTGAKQSTILKEAILTDGFDVGRSKEYIDGEFIVQDISAMLASVVLSPKPGEKVLDMCSAPGGKTTHLAQLMENSGSIEAWDIYEHKIQLVLDNAKRMGIDIIDAKICDATKLYNTKIGMYNKILADVPCSGLGIIRKKPDIKKKSPESGLSEIQYKILENAAAYLAPGGELVYSTCTLNKRENEEVVFRFLDNNPGYEAVDITEMLPEMLRTPENKKGYVTLFPNHTDIDGFFIFKIKRCKND